MWWGWWLCVGVVALLGVAFLKHFLLDFWMRTPSKAPPSLPGPLPFFGNVIPFAKDPVGFMESRLAKHGSVFRFRLAGLWISLLDMPDRHGFFFNKPEQVLSFRGAYVNMFKDVVGEDAFAVTVPVKTLFRSGMDSSKYHGFAGLIVGEVEEFFAPWVERARKAGSQGVPFRLFREFNELVLTTTCRCLMGQEVRDTPGLFDRLHDIEGGFNAVGLFLPGLPLPDLIKRRRARDAILEAFGNIIRKRKSTCVEAEDMLQVLLEARDENGDPLPENHLKGLLLSFIFVGQVQTYGAAAWTVLHLLNNPDRLSIVLEELHRETQGQRLDFAALCRLHELHKCLKESVRLTAPVLMLRKVGPEGLELPESGGMFVPAGELVAVSPYVLHHRPDIYPRPFDWLPQRWDEDSDLVHPPASNMHFIGFGKGLHSCLGEAFAYLEMKAMIATLLHHFSPCMEGPMPEPDFTHLGGLVVPKKECAFHLVLRE